jgi:3-hydroxyisobutyrate dehydrogenase-like beta-hydroxyacid dehydrogenase
VKLMAERVRVGLIGVGAMGRGMGRNLLEQGFPLTVQDRDPAAVERLQTLGAEAVETPAQVAQRSDLVITVVPDGPDVETVTLGPDGVASGGRPGLIVMDCSTIDPSVTLRVGEQLRARGMRMVDAGMGRSSLEAEAGQLLFMVGAEEADFAAVRPALEAMGSDVFHVGPAGHGITLKLVHNLLSLTLLAADCEALVLGARAGLDVRRMLEVLQTSSTGHLHFQTIVPNQVLTGDYRPGFRVSLAIKDLLLGQQLAARLGVPLQTLALSRELYMAAQARGLGQQASGAIVSVLEEMVGARVRDGLERPLVGTGRVTERTLDRSVDSAGRPRMGLVGIGAMGRGMGKNLLRQGFPLTVCDANPAAVETLQTLGAEAVETPAQVAERSEIVITVVPTGADVEAIALGPNGLAAGGRPGLIHVDCSTIAPAETARIGAALRAQRIRMVDAGMGRSSAEAEAGRILFMVGAEPEDFTAVLPALEAMGNEIFHVGPPGHGITLKLVHNLLVLTMLTADAETLMLGARAGLDVRKMLEVLLASSTGHFHLQTTVPNMMLTGDYRPGFKIALAYKDLLLAQQLAAELRVPLQTLAIGRELFTAAMALGRGELANGAVVTVLEDLLGFRLRDRVSATA